MGKGSRNRQVRTDDMVTNPQKYVQKKPAPKYPTYIALAVVVVVAIALILSAFVNNGTFLRMQQPIKSEHYEVTGTMMSYYAHTVYSNYVNQYQQNYGSYINSSSGFTIYDLMGIKSGVALNKQVRDNATGETWFDYFMGQAREQVEQILLYCEGAYAAGIELDEEDMAEIDLSVQMLATYGTLYGYSANSYLSQMYGVGVREKDVRAAMELSTLASKYLTTLSDEYHEAATAADVDAFYAENENDYLSADYLIYRVTADITNDSTDDEIAAAKAEVDATVETLMAATTPEEFREAVKAYLTTITEGEDVEAKIEETLDAMTVEDYLYNVSSDQGKWIFGEEGGTAAKVNTAHKIVSDTTAPAEDETTTTTKAYSVSVYFLTRAASRTEDLTYDITYLALPKTSYSEDDAKAALAAFETAGKTQDALLALAGDYPSYTACTSVENAADGFFGMEDIDNWIYGGERKAGDYSLLTGTTSDNATYYVIVLIDAEGDPVWYVNALDALVVSKTEEWLADAAEIYPVHVNENALDNINM